MNRLKRTLTALGFALLATTAFAALPSKHEVLRAISVLEKDVATPEASEAAKTIVTFAQDSQDVMVDIGPGQIPWATEKFGLDKDRELTCQSMLLAAFVAGNIRSQIKNDRAEDDTYSGWIFAIETYNRLRAKSAFHSPSIESLAKMQADGTLLDHAREVRLKDAQEEPAEPEHKPFA
jgi:hypothetical protein